MLAVHLCILKYRDILSHAHGITIHIETDHLDLLAEGDSSSARVRRMWASLYEFPIVTIKHVSGVSNCLADHLSRADPPTTFRTFVAGVASSIADVAVNSINISLAQKSATADEERRALVLTPSAANPAVLTLSDGALWIPSTSRFSAQSFGSHTTASATAQQRAPWRKSATPISTGQASSAASMTTARAAPSAYYRDHSRIKSITAHQSRRQHNRNTDCRTSRWTISAP